LSGSITGGNLARKEREQFVRGLWEREPGSGVWWIRYRDSNGKLHREKIGRKSDAQDLLIKRRNQRRIGVKMPFTPAPFFRLIYAGR
jgi:hypothetical protein